MQSSFTNLVRRPKLEKYSMLIQLSVLFFLFVLSKVFWRLQRVLSFSVHGPRVTVLTFGSKTGIGLHRRSTEILAFKAVGIPRRSVFFPFIICDSYRVHFWWSIINTSSLFLIKKLCDYLEFSLLNVWNIELTVFLMTLLSPWEFLCFFLHSYVNKWCLYHVTTIPFENFARHEKDEKPRGKIYHIAFILPLGLSNRFMLFILYAIHTCFNYVR
jgi:hypothetical protein